MRLKQHRGTLLLALSLMTPLPVMGQDAGGSDATLSAVRIDLRVALGRHGTGNEKNCPGHAALSSGLSASSRGPWIGSVSADVFVTWPGVCNDGGRGAIYNGEDVEVRGTTELLFSPRFTAHMGRQFAVGAVIVAPTIGAGLLLTRSDWGFDQVGSPEGPIYRVIAHSWRPWYGVTVGIHPEAHRFSFQVEIGRHPITQRYHDLVSSELLLEFDHWHRFTRFGVSVPLR